MEFAATRFVIESESLVTDGGANSLEFERCMNHLLEVWEYFGVLVEDATDSFETFSRREDFLSRMSIKYRHKFERLVLSRVGRRNFRRETLNRPISWDAITTVDLLNCYVGDFELAFVESRRAHQLGLPSGGDDFHNSHNYCTNCDNVSISLWSLAKETCKFKSRPMVIREGTSLAYRKEKIGELASRSSQVVVVDRYAFTHMYDSNGIYQVGNGLTQLLRLLDELGSVWHIAIYSFRSTYKKEGSEERNERIPVQWIRRDLQNELNSFNNIVEMEVFLPSPRTFQRKAHGRHVRFDDNRACTIDIGPSAFMDRNLRQAQFTPIVGDELKVPIDEGEISLKEIEDNLAKDAKGSYRFTLTGN